MRAPWQRDQALARRHEPSQGLLQACICASSSCGAAAAATPEANVAERGAGGRRLGKELVRGGEGAVVWWSGSHQLMVVRVYARCSSSSVVVLLDGCSAKERDADEARLGVAQGLSNGAAGRAESYGQGSSGTCSGSWRAGFCVVYNFL